MGRIVVNLEPGATPARQKPRRWTRILALVAVVVVGLIALAAAGAFFWWRHYQTTPVYSLALLVHAAQHNDKEELAKRMDDEEIVRNLVGRVSQKAGDRYGLAMTTNTKQQIDQVVSSSSARLKQTIHDEVANELKNLGDAQPKSFVFLLLAIPTLVTITTEGDIAKAVSTMSNRTFEVMMHRDGDRWKAVGFNDDRVVQRLVDSVMKDLPAIGAIDANNPLFKNPGKPRKRRR